MKRLSVGLLLCGSLMCLPKLVAADSYQDTPRLLLAHYMPCFPPITNTDPTTSYGYQGQFDVAQSSNGNLTAKPVYTPLSKTGDLRDQAFVAEIRIAKAAGIDGFLVDQLEDSEGYRASWLGLLHAAEEVGNFKIGLTPDESCIGAPVPVVRKGSKPGDPPMRQKVLHWLQLAQHSSALLRYHGKPVLAPYGVDYYDGPGSSPGATGKGSPAAEHDLVNWLASQGMPVSYIPDHSLDSNAYTSPFERDPTTGFQTFSIGQASFSPSASRALRDRALAYWPPSQLIMGEVAFVYYNKGWNYTAPRLSSKYRDEWMWNIEHRDRVHWVQIITWNDLGETAIEPTTNHYLSFLTLTRYYSDWFKTGKQPTIKKDVLYLFHRASPYAAVATANSYRVKSNHPADEVEALAFLTEPATLVLQTGNDVQRENVPAGIQSFIIPFNLGVQMASIERDGKVVEQISTPIPITDKPSRENLWFVGADSLHPPRSLPLNDWTADKGSWTGEGDSRTGTGLSLVGDDSSWEDYRVKATFVPATDAAGLVLRAEPKGHYEFTATSDPAGVKWQVTRNDAAGIKVLDSNVFPAKAGEPVHLRFDCAGEHLVAFINDTLVSSDAFDFTYPLGRAGVAASGANPVTFSQVQVESYDPVMRSANANAAYNSPVAK